MSSWNMLGIIGLVCLAVYYIPLLTFGAIFILTGHAIAITPLSVICYWFLIAQLRIVSV